MKDRLLELVKSDINTVVGDLMHNSLIYDTTYYNTLIKQFEQIENVNEKYGNNYTLLLYASKFEIEKAFLT